MTAFSSSRKIHSSQQIVPHIGAMQVQKSARYYIETLHTTLRIKGRTDGKGGLAPRTIGHVHRLLSEALGDAAENDLALRNVMEGSLGNLGYEKLFTDVFDLQRKDYNAKRVLDIGCGPCGSLEWADMTTQRVGLDPLVRDYLKLGADKHKMEYVAAGSENIPFPDGHFDIVTCLNALDHVDDLDRTIHEVKRVVKRGGFSS